MKQNKKRKIRWTRILPLIAIIALLLLNIISYVILANKVINALGTKCEVIEETQEEVQEEVTEDTCKVPGCKPEFREVIFTNYYVDDSDNSRDMTASGLSSKNFVAVDGIYQYKGLDVLATANTTRWNRNLKEGYVSHELYEIITYELNGKTRKGIVLDLCGACMGLKGESLQRYDIYTTSNVIGKKKGLILRVERNKQ